MLRLRDYQRASLDALSAAWARGGADDAAPGHLIVLPTGAGKALVIAALARETLDENPSPGWRSSPTAASWSPRISPS